MQDINGVTRREFDRLASRVEVLFDKGSPKSAVIEREVQNLREALNGQGISLRDAISSLNKRIDSASAMLDDDIKRSIDSVTRQLDQMEKRATEKIGAIEVRVERKLTNQNRLLWAIFLAIVVGLIGIITTLIVGIADGSGGEAWTLPGSVFDRS